MTRRVPLDAHAALVRRWRTQRESWGRAKAALEAAERELLAALGEADEGTLAGEPAVRREVQTRPGIDLDKLRADCPELVQRYRIQRSRTRLKFPVPQRKHR